MNQINNMVKKNEEGTNVGRRQIEDLLFNLLRTFYQFERIEVSTFDLSYDMIYILKLLYRLPCIRVSDIAEEMKIKVFSATRLVDQLEKRKMVRRKKNKEDLRIIEVSITAKGKKMVEKIEDHALGLINARMDMFTPDEFKTIRKTIRNLNEIMGIEKSRFLNF